MALQQSFGTVFGLGFDVAVSPDTKSGFQPVVVDARSGAHFFGDLRLEGFAGLLQTGFAETLIIVSGMDYLYGAEEPIIIHEAVLIREMLVRDFGIDPQRVSCLESAPHSDGNVVVIEAQAKELPGRCAVVTSHYHVPRAQIALLPLPVYPAEALVLLQNPERRDEIVNRLGGGPLAQRVVLEANGIADRLRDAYKPLTESKA